MPPAARSATSRYHARALRAARCGSRQRELRVAQPRRQRRAAAIASRGEAALRVYPNFAAVARYAWLAGDRAWPRSASRATRSAAIGTDFKQLADYRPGDSIRHIDWKATLRHGKPIVREYQDERDQRIVFMLDCGRRMRADEGRGRGPRAATSTQRSTP